VIFSAGREAFDRASPDNYESAEARRLLKAPGGYPVTKVPLISASAKACWIYISRRGEMCSDALDRVPSLLAQAGTYYAQDDYYTKDSAVNLPDGMEKGRVSRPYGS